MTLTICGTISPADYPRFKEVLDTHNAFCGITAILAAESIETAVRRYAVARDLKYTIVYGKESEETLNKQSILAGGECFWFHPSTHQNSKADDPLSATQSAAKITVIRLEIPDDHSAQKILF